ncbi:MAG: isochorismatase family protein [Pirellulales bacterium]
MKNVIWVRRMSILSVVGLLGWFAMERLTGAQPADDKSKDVFRLHLRTRVETAKGSGVWQEKVAEARFVPGETAIVICDMWNKHWCQSASRRCDALARKMAPIIDSARARGVRIIHAPSDTMDFYKDSSARRRMLAVPKVEPPKPIGGWYSLELAKEGPLPIDDADGGCDDQPQCRQGKAWSRQHPAISVRDEDVVSENGREVYSYLRQQGIKNIIYVGVHTNMCVLGRSFGIRQMTTLGFNTVLVRDLTDTMYNPRQRPFVSHDRGTELVIEHVEKHWCPTITSEDLAAKR